MIETSSDSTERVSGFISHRGGAGFINRLRLRLSGNPGCRAAARGNNWRARAHELSDTSPLPWNDPRHGPFFPHGEMMENTMNKITTIGAGCLAIALAATSPALARGPGGPGGGGFHGGGGGGAHFAGGGFHGGGIPGGGARFAAGGFHGGGVPGGGARFAASGFNGGGIPGGGARFAGGGFRGGGFRDHGFHHHGGFGPGIAAGLIAGSVIGAGAYYDDYAYAPDYDDYASAPAYYGDSYAAVGDAPVADGGYCAQRYRSYDPASGTYLGYDGLRHPCQ
jgi:BA14K-like protein